MPIIVMRKIGAISLFSSLIVTFTQNGNKNQTYDAERLGTKTFFLILWQ
jgi:hypothetical protein